MVYSCQFCGAWFSKELLNDVINNNEKIINCPYCNNVNEMERIKTSHVAKGYDSLEYGDFYSASMEFGEALKSVKNVDPSTKSEFLDAYLGRALSQYSVQVIYDGEIADDSAEPEINCYICNDMFLEDTYDYQVALQIARSIHDVGLRERTINRVQRFAKKIDGIKSVYDRKAARGDEYQLFIACEDDTDDARDGLNVANKIRDSLPSAINRVFIQDKDAFSESEYEGEILYALHHSKCMVVAVDNDIAPRLMNLYSRYHRAMRTEGNKQLGFVRFKDRTQIHLPDHSMAEHVYEIDEKGRYVKFVCEANNIFYTGPVEVAKPKVEAAPEAQAATTVVDSGMFGEHGPIVDGHICRFGSYPQRRVMDQAIISLRCWGRIIMK